MKSTQQKVAGYYSKLESKLGYKYLMWDAKHFGYYPDNFSKINERQALENQQDLIAKILNLKPNELVLDAGCGRGVTSCFIAEKYHAKIIGIDIVDFELEIAKQRAVSKKLGKLATFYHMDYSELNFPDNYFDCIYTSESLSHAQNLIGVLKEFNRVLKPGGRIALFEYTISDDEFFSKKEMESLNFIIEGSAMAGLKSFRHNRFLNILKNVGFTNTKEVNISNNVKPSFRRLYSKSSNFYGLIKLFGLKKHFVNLATPTELLPLIEKDLIRYNIFSAAKAEL